MKARFLAFGFVMLALLLAVPAALAQDGTDSTTIAPIEFTGTITGLDTGTLLLMVNDLTVDASEAEINTTLALDARVKVEGELLEDGTVSAYEINAPDDDDDDMGDDRRDDRFDDDRLDDDLDDDNELELVAVLGSLDTEVTGVAIVGGLSFELAGAEIAPGLQIGDWVKVEARYDPAEGVWYATELEPYHPDDDDRFDDRDDDRFDDRDDDWDDDDDECRFEIEVRSANVRLGPGTGYDVIGYAYDDQEFPVLEIDATGTWIKVAFGAGEGWLAISTGELDDCSGLPESSMRFRERDDDRYDDDRYDDDWDDDHDDDDDDDWDDDHDDDDDDDWDDDHDDDDDDDDDDD